MELDSPNLHSKKCPLDMAGACTWSVYKHVSAEASSIQQFNTGNDVRLVQYIGVRAMS